MMEQLNLNLPPAPKRTLSFELGYELVMLKTLPHFGSVAKAQAELSARAKADPGMGEFLDAFTKWSSVSDQNASQTRISSVHFSSDQVSNASA
jgi:hypothetical protein